MITPTPAGQISDLHTHGMNFTERQQFVHLSTPSFRAIQFVIPAGAAIPTHEAEGEIILHCLEGEITVNVGSARHNLTAGHLLYLAVNEAFTVCAVKNASLLATIIAPKDGDGIELIGGKQLRSD